MQRVYFVRHGETVSNRDNILQGLDDVLSPRGEIQAAQVAVRTKGISFSHILSSDAVRAARTAEEISKESNVPVEFSPLFREVARPSSMIGKPRDSEIYEKFLVDDRENYGNPDWRCEDAENYEDVRQRAVSAIELLESKKDTDILVVTHGNFLRFMTSYLLVKKEITPEIWKYLGHTLLMTNTGITTFKHEDGLWQMITWNDHSHFAE